MEKPPLPKKPNPPKIDPGHALESHGGEGARRECRGNRHRLPVGRAKRLAKAAAGEQKRGAEHRNGKLQIHAFIPSAALAAAACART